MFLSDFLNILYCTHKQQSIWPEFMCPVCANSRAQQIRLILPSVIQTAMKQNKDNIAVETWTLNDSEVGIHIMLLL